MADVEEPVEETPVEEPEAGFAAEEEEEDFVAVGGATEVKLFGKWSFDDIEVRDISLVVSVFIRDNGAIGACLYLCLLIAMKQIITGLHCMQGRPCYLLASHRWQIPEEAIPQGIVPNR